jgi:hypothetical protein
MLDIIARSLIQQYGGGAEPADDREDEPEDYVPYDHTDSY